jgi:hypothetical protein
MQYFSFMFKDHLRVNYLRSCLRFAIMIVFTEAMFLYSRTYKLHAIFQQHILKLQHHWLSGYYKHAKPRWFTTDVFNNCGVARPSWLNCAIYAETHPGSLRNHDGSRSTLMRVSFRSWVTFVMGAVGKIMTEPFYSQPREERKVLWCWNCWGNCLPATLHGAELSKNLSDLAVIFQSDFDSYLSFWPVEAMQISSKQSGDGFVALHKYHSEFHTEQMWITETRKLLMLLRS